MDKTHKWKMNRAGLLNFWYYDEETFDFADGKLLLRGSNGSGKSVTMQSILPVLLDGKKSPDRLDPFGSKSRRMEDYLLGEKDVVDRDERTGYLFLEYKRDDTQQYITTGIGLQARRHKNMNFWGFVITDNRRIGHDFFLYEWENNGGEKQRIPLSRQQLENRIASGGQVVRAQGEYMKLVNKYVFGFENLEAYEDLIKLLIQLRSPKLSKEFRPSAIHEILEASLPPLTDEDLRHLSDTIEHMDQTKQQIEQLQREQTALEHILKRYDTYNQYKLALKADKYNQALYNCNEVGRTVHNKQEESANLDAAIGELQERHDSLTRKQSVLEQKRLRLQNHQVWNLEKERQDEQEALKAIEDDYSKKYASLTDKKRQELSANEKYSRLEAEQDEQERAFAEVLADLDADAEASSFNQHALNRNDFERHQANDHDFTIWKQEAEQHYQTLDAISEQLRELEQQKEKMTELDTRMASAKMQRDQRQQEEQDWLQLFEDDKQRKLAEIHTWQAEHDFLPVTDALLQQAARNMDTLYEPVSYDTVRTGFIEAGNEHQMQMKEQIAGENGRITQLDAAIADKQDELETIQAKRDPEPPGRQGATRESREELAAAGHAFMPLYEAVTFQDHIPDDVRMHIEAALLDTGLLDALITEETGTIEHDRLLKANPHLMAHTLDDYLQPDVGNMAVNAARVHDILRSIRVDSSADAEDSTAVNADGTYTIGLISGHAIPVDSVRFIGRHARERYRQEQMDQLKQEIADLQSEKDTCKQTVDYLQASVQAAKDAIFVFPEDTDLAESFSHIKEKRFEIKQYDKQLQELDEQLKQLHESYRSIKSQLDATTHGLDLVFSREAYQEAKQTMREYEKRLHQLINEHTSYRYTLEQLVQLNERLEELAGEVDELQGECNMLADRQSRKTQNIAEIEKQLEAAGVEEIRQQIQTVQSDMTATASDLDQVKTDLPRHEANKQTIDREIETVQQQWAFWNNMASAWQDVFMEEAQLNLVELPEPQAAPNDLATAVIQQYQSVLEKDPSVIESQLTSVYFEEQSNLMEYRMTDRNMPATAYEWMADNWTDEQRLYIDDWKQQGGRRLIQLDFQGKQVSPYYMREKVASDRDQQQFMLDDQDRQLYEEILFDSVGKKLRSRITRAQDWTEKMDRLMTNSDSSSGLSFSIKWKPRTAETEDEMDTKQLVELLRRDARLLKEDDINQVINHFRSRIERAKELVEMDGEANTLLQVLKEVLDYRNWFSFVLYYQRPGEPKRELTNHAFYKFSGGEKAMAMYIPLFTACYSRYLEAGDTAPYIISLDEAFAGVDENNIREMFEIVEELGFDYIMNSQVLWGDYDTVSALSICELIRPKAEDFVSVIRYQWDGHKRHLVTGQEEAAATQM